MYSSKISVILLFSILTFATNINGFLLEPDHTSNPGVNNQCISMDTCMYLAEKKELRNQIFQFQIENEKSLQILTNQIQHKFTAMDDKLQNNNKPNNTIEYAKLEQKYRDLELNFTLLQQSNRLLQSSYVHQKDELALLRNTTTEFRKELSELKQMKSVQQAIDLHAVQSKIVSLEQKANSLTINQNARSQDFLVLNNMTRVMANKVNLIGNRVYDIETKQNTTFTDVLSKISSLEGKVSNNSKRVAVTACVGSAQKFSDSVVRFATVRSEIGIDNIATFKSSGKFVCESPGLYFISAHIDSNEGSQFFNVRKNSDIIGYSETGGGNDYTTSSVTAVAELQVKDTLYVYSGTFIYHTYSCMSIVKVK